MAMTREESIAAEAITLAMQAVEWAQDRCQVAACTGDVVVAGLDQALTELRDVLLVVQGKV